MPRAFFGPFFRFERKDFSPRGRPESARQPPLGTASSKVDVHRYKHEAFLRTAITRFTLPCLFAQTPSLPYHPPAPTSESVSIPHDAKNAPMKRYASPMPFPHSFPLPFLYFQNKETPPFHGRQRSFEPIVLYNAFFGQDLAHSKHRMHSVPFFRLRELSVISTSMGHTFLHFPQETHLLWSH